MAQPTAEIVRAIARTVVRTSQEILAVSIDDKFKDNVNSAKI